MDTAKKRKIGPASATMRAILNDVRPRARFYQQVGVKSSYANHLLQGQEIGATSALARVTGQILVPRLGRPAAAEALLASLEEWHPEAFVVDGHAEEARPSPAHTEPAEGGQEATPDAA